MQTRISRPKQITSITLKFPYEETKFPAKIFDQPFYKKVVAEGIPLLNTQKAEGISVNIKLKE